MIKKHAPFYPVAAPGCPQPSRRLARVPWYTVAGDEIVTKSCIRERWKGYSEFMFWGSFSYDKKGPCHIYCVETKAEKEEAARQISHLNDALEPAMRQDWELSTAMRRTGLRNKPGKKPEWRWTVKNGKLVRGQGGGIDWWRYQSCVLLPKLLPFAKECLKDRPGTVVQEDKAPAHAHHYQTIIYTQEDIKKIFWCGNSPDLNAIEPAWPYLKRETTKKGAPKNRQEAVKVWEKAWADLPQSNIQAWIERIPVHVQKIIQLEGGNEYKEGRGQPRVYPKVR